MGVAGADQAGVGERAAAAELVSVDEGDPEALLGEGVGARDADRASAHDHRVRRHGLMLRTSVAPR